MTTRWKQLARGFTIVELLVVIAVLGILVSIVVVSYAGTQNRAKRNSFESNASQVKVKLGDYMTDKNSYPVAKSDVITYLNAIGAGTLATEFNKSAYQYTTTPSGCTGTSCTGYSITVANSNWNSSTDANIVVQP